MEDTTKKITYVSVAIIMAGLLVGGIAYLINTNNQRTAENIRESGVLDVKDERMIKGDIDNPLSVVEYADILCPYCARAHNEILPRIEADYIDTGKARFEVRLVGIIRPDSQRAAEGAYCAAEQGKFWDYLDKAYQETWDDFYSQGKGPEEVDTFNDRNIEAFAERVGVGSYPWKECMESGKYREALDKNVDGMRQIQAYGTPYFLFNGIGYGSGAPEYTVFQKALDAEYRKVMDDK